MKERRFLSVVSHLGYNWRDLLDVLLSIMLFHQIWGRKKNLLCSTFFLFRRVLETSSIFNSARRQDVKRRLCFTSDSGTYARLCGRLTPVKTRQPARVSASCWQLSVPLLHRSLPVFLCFFNSPSSLLMRERERERRKSL